jgi:hypothetical protein
VDGCVVRVTWYASAGSLDMPWLPLPGFKSRAVGVAVYSVWVRAASEANRGGDGMAVGPIGAGSDRGWRGIVPHSAQ